MNSVLIGPDGNPWFDQSFRHWGPTQVIFWISIAIIGRFSLIITLFLGDGGVFNKMKKMTINAVKLANHLSSDSFNLHKSIKKNESYNEVAPMGEPFSRIFRFSETWLLTYLALVVPTVSAKPIFDTIDSFTFTREYVLNSRGKVSNVKVSNITRSYDTITW